MSNSFGFGGNNCSLIFGKSALMQVFLQSVGIAGTGVERVDMRPDRFFAGVETYRHDPNAETDPRYSLGRPNVVAAALSRASRHRGGPGSLA